MGLIRCDHCGWSNNPEDAKRCQKCNQELEVPVIEPVSKPTQPLNSTPIPTSVPDAVKKDDSALANCSNCGYPISPEMSLCPNCGFQTASANAMRATQRMPEKTYSTVDPAMKATMRDVSSEVIGAVVTEETKGLVLPMSSAAPVQQDVHVAPPVSKMLNQTVRIDAEPVPAATKKIISGSAAFRLKPLDTDASEIFAFGSDTAASFVFDDGRWFITDESGTESVFVSAARRVALELGDVIIMGGRKYIFG